MTAKQRGFLWLGLFLFSLLANAIGGKWFASREGADFGVEPTRIAAALMHGHGFRDPYAPMPTGPTAHVAPLYPAFYAGLMTVFGTGLAGWWAIRLFTVAAYAAQLALLPALATKLRLPLRAGLLAAGIGAVIPLPGGSYKWEAIFAGLVLAAAAYFIAAIWARPSSTASAVAAGLLGGVGFLLSPVLMPIWVAWTCTLAFFLRRNIRARTLALLFILPFVITAPWIIRNYRVFGAFIFVRDNLGTELAASNNDCATPWAKDNQVHPACFAQVHPNASRDLDRRIVEVGEYRFNVERQRVARSWIVADPVRFLRLSLQRFIFFWFPVVAEASGVAKLTALLISLLTVTSLAGLWLLWSYQKFAFALTLSCLMLYPAVYYLVQVELRFRYPILWVMLLLTGFAADRLYSRTAIRWRR